jgi:anti-sigma factor RsiW
MKHLTDNEIQSYLHSLTSDERARSEDHLNGCSDCQKKLLLYKKLGDVVVSSSSNPIPEGFERTVMGRLRSTQRQKRLNDVIVTAVAIMGFVLIGSIVFLTPQLKHIVTMWLMDAWQYGSELAAATEGSSDAIDVLAFGATLFVLFAAIDRLTIGRLGFATRLRGYSEID